MWLVRILWEEFQSFSDFEFDSHDRIWHGDVYQPENMAKKIQDFASTQQQADGMRDLVLQVENICVQACKELEEEYNSIKNTNAWKMKK